MAQVSTPASNVTIFFTDYNELLQLQQSHALASPAIVVPQSGKLVAFVSKSSLRPWILDFGAFDHIIGNQSFFFSIVSFGFFALITLIDGS